MLFKNSRVFELKILIIVLLVNVVNYSSAKNIDVIQSIANKNVTLLFNAKDDQIWQLNISGKEQNAVTDQLLFIPYCGVSKETDFNNCTFSTANIVDFDFDYRSHRVYLMSWDERLYYTGLEKPEMNLAFWYDYFELIFGFTKRKFALDFVNEKVYIIQQEVIPLIEVINYNGTQRSIVYEFNAVNVSKGYVSVEDQEYYGGGNETMGFVVTHEIPYGIVLDPYEGIMFVLTNISGTSRIHRANMDGSSLNLIVSNAGKIGGNCGRIDIDRYNKRIYWTNCENQIVESVDYNGNERTTVVKSQCIVGFAVYDNQIFWSANNTNATLRSRINSCKLDNNVCSTDQIQNISVNLTGEVPYRIKAINSTPRINVTNPCSNENGGCQHLCLLKSNDNKLSYSCACNIGYRISSDKKTCEPINKYLLYIKNNMLVGKDVESNITSYPILPRFAYNIFNSTEDMAVIAYNKKDNQVYYGDCGNLIQFGIDDTYRSRWLENDIGLTICRRHMVYDTSSGEFYGTIDINNSTGLYHYIASSNITKDSSRRSKPKNNHLTNLNIKTLSLAVHPTEGVYLLTYNATLNSSVLSKIKTNSTNRTAEFVLNNIEFKNVSGIAIGGDLLYWYTHNGTIGQANLQGTDIKILTESPIKNINSMVLDDDWIYLKNNTCVWRVSKAAGHKAEIFVPEEKFTVLRSNLQIAQRPKDELPYGKDYSMTKVGCKTFCLFKDEGKAQSHWYDSPDAKLCKCNFTKKNAGKILIDLNFKIV